MATRSSITAKVGKQYVGVYCHNDGYPSGVGQTLFLHHNSQEAAEAIVALGALSQLHAQLAPNVGEEHSFDDPIHGVTIAYHRDRDEDMMVSRGPSWKVAREKIDAAYHYLFEDGLWFCTSEYGTFEKIPLTRFIDGEDFADDPI